MLFTNQEFLLSPKMAFTSLCSAHFLYSTFISETVGINLYLNDRITFGRTYPVAGTSQHARDNAAMQVILQLSRRGRLYLNYAGGRKELVDLFCMSWVK